MNFTITASLAVRSTPRAKRMCLLTFLDVRNAISHFFSTNNRIIISFSHVQINVSTKISIFFRKRGVYELLEILQYFHFFCTRPPSDANHMHEPKPDPLTQDEETYFTIFFSCYPWYNQGTEYKTHAVKQRRQMINNTNGYVFWFM